MGGAVIGLGFSVTSLGFRMSVPFCGMFLVSAMMAAIQFADVAPRVTLTSRGPDRQGRGRCCGADSRCRYHMPSQ